MTPPIVIITTNRTREIHDALKRRCLYHWVDYPNAERELEILRRKVPEVSQAAVSARWSPSFRRIRQEDLFKAPGVAETHRLGDRADRARHGGARSGAVSDTLGVSC